MRAVNTFLLHFGLFAVTLITTTFAGSSWVYGKNPFLGDYSWHDFLSGLPYSVPFLLILSVHEFGHYFTARYHRVRVTLPYYIPLPPLPFLFGTLGALIRIKSRVPSTRVHFDIGIAGPLAGFVAAVGVLWYGFTHLPPPEYVFQFHPDYKIFGLDYAAHVYEPGYMTTGADVLFGKNLLFLFFEKFVADPARVPNPHEIIHYPWLLAGYLALVFTALNLMPIGQLDGGHVLYGLVGYRKHKIIASVFYVLFLFYAGLGYVNPYTSSSELAWQVPLAILFYFFSLRSLGLPLRDTWMWALAIFALQYGLTYFFPMLQGYSGWLLFAFLIGRFVGISHPPSPDEAPLNTTRKILGWLAFLIFILCATPNPIEVIIMGAE